MYNTVRAAQTDATNSGLLKYECPIGTPAHRNILMVFEYAKMW